MRILLVVNPDRRDMYEYLGQDQNSNYLLLWGESRKARDYASSLETYPVRFDEVYYWDEFASPYQLFKRVKPDKIVFMEIIDLRQIATIVAAKACGITTFYLEHGAAGSSATAIARWDEQSFREGKFKHLVKRLTSLGVVLKSKAYYYSVLAGFNSMSSRHKYWILPLKMLKDSSNKVLSHNIFNERVPKHCIVFSRINLDEFALYTGITEEQALLTGVPFFDRYYSKQPIEGDHLVYIDHPYCEEGIADWTPQHHETIARKLFLFAKQNRQKVYVKLHPRSNRELWESYGYDENWITILQTEDCTQLYLESKLILGFSSSLTTAFLCARKNFVLLGWHPEPRIFGMDFSANGLCHKSLELEDLDNRFQYWCKHNLTGDAVKYAEFIHLCNEPFDGKATERVLNAIHTL
jgi:hypothetical protein